LATFLFPPVATGARWQRAAPWLIVALAFALHAAWFRHPLQVVFDEIYFPRFALAYLDGSWYFDLHPPLAKLLLGGTAWLLGLDPSFSYATNGLPFPDPSYALLRLPVHATGVLLPLVLYGIARELQLSVFAATVVGLLAALDNALLAITRIAVTDGFLLLFGFAALWAYLRHRRTGSWLLLGAAALMAGAALAVKWTGLSFIGLIAVLEGVRLLRERRPAGLARLALVALLPAAVYVGSFAVHFALLDRVGREAPTGLSPAFLATLQGTPQAADPNQRRAGFVERLVEIHHVIANTQRTLAARHQYASRWYDWPFMMRSVDYWAQYHENSLSRIFLIGNPAVWWATGYAILYLLVNFVPKLPALLARTQPPPAGFPELLVVGSYLANMLPFVPIRRVMFLYHYLPALCFALLGLGLLIDRCGRHARWVGISLLLLAVTAFLYFAPLSYGLPLTREEFDARFWLKGWK
jgi:dolichyl-phosphate-mannose-protein mannosyltransferase